MSLLHEHLLVSLPHRQETQADRVKEVDADLAENEVAHEEVDYEVRLSEHERDGGNECCLSALLPFHATW